MTPRRLSPAWLFVAIPAAATLALIPFAIAELVR